MDGVMIEGCWDGVTVELKCSGWIEMLVVSSFQDVVPVWMFNRCRGVPRSLVESTRRTLLTVILASTAASVMTLLQKWQDCTFKGNTGNKLLIR